MRGFKHVAAGWISDGARYFKEILRLSKPDQQGEHIFFIYEGPDGFGIARLRKGEDEPWQSPPFDEETLINISGDLLLIASDEKMWENWAAISQQCLGALKGPVGLALEIRTENVLVRLKRYTWSGRVEYVVDIDPLRISLDADEFRRLAPALARALKRSRSITVHRGAS